MTLVLTIPQEQVEVGFYGVVHLQKRQKLEKAIYTFIDILFTNHMETLTKMAIEGFISVIRFVIAGIDSYGICEQNE